MADPGRFDADPDPTFQVNSDTVRKKNSFKYHFFLLNNLTQLFVSNFLTNNEGEGARVRDKV